MTVRVHPFPSRTRQLSSLVPTILGWKRPGTIGRRQHNKTPHDKVVGCFVMTWADSSNTFGFAARRNDGCLSRQETYFNDFATRSQVDAYAKKEIIQSDGLFCFCMDGNGLHPTLAVPEIPNAHYRSRDFDRGANPCSLHPPPAAVASVAHPEHGS